MQLPYLNLPHRTTLKIVETNAPVLDMEELSNSKLMAKKSWFFGTELSKIVVRLRKTFFHSLFVSLNSKMIYLIKKKIIRVIVEVQKFLLSKYLLDGKLYYRFLNLILNS